MQAAPIRDVVLATLRDLGHPGRVELDVRPLFFDGACVGLCFDAEGIFALWLMVLDEVKFVDAAGNLLTVVRLGEAVAVPRRKVA